MAGSADQPQRPRENHRRWAHHPVDEPGRPRRSRRTCREAGGRARAPDPRESHHRRRLGATDDRHRTRAGHPHRETTTRHSPTEDRSGEGRAGGADQTRRRPVRRRPALVPVGHHRRRRRPRPRAAGAGAAPQTRPGAGRASTGPADPAGRAGVHGNPTRRVVNARRLGGAPRRPLRRAGHRPGHRVHRGHHPHRPVRTRAGPVRRQRPVPVRARPRRAHRMGRSAGSAAGAGPGPRHHRRRDRRW